jgi:hypothetical protein
MTDPVLDRYLRTYFDLDKTPLAELLAVFDGAKVTYGKFLADLGVRETSDLAYRRDWAVGATTRLLANRDPAACRFLLRLVGLGCAIWVGRPGGKDQEFNRPTRWQSAPAFLSLGRVESWRPGFALCLNCGGPFAVTDIDPRNGGDIEAVRQLLAELEVRIFAEVDTPGGGRHFYVAAHLELATVHSNGEGEQLPGFPGVDFQGPGTNVFLPGTERPKYGGKGYTVLFDDLEALR